MARSEETNNPRPLKRDHQQACSSKSAGGTSLDGSPRLSGALGPEPNTSPDSKQSKRLKVDSEDRSEDLVSDLLGHQVRVSRRPRSSRKSGAESQGTLDGDDDGSRSCSTDEEDDKAAAEALLGFSLGTDQVEQMSAFCPGDKLHAAGAVSDAHGTDPTSAGRSPSSKPMCVVASSLGSPAAQAESLVQGAVDVADPTKLDDIQLPQLCVMPVTDGKAPMGDPSLCHVGSSCTAEAALQHVALSKPLSPHLPSYMDTDTAMPVGVSIEDMTDLLSQRIPMSTSRPPAPVHHMTYPDLSIAHSAQSQMPAHPAQIQLPAPAYAAPLPAQAPPPASTAETKPSTTSASKGTGSTGKSELTVLCEKFQERFGRLHDDGSPREIMLKEVAEDLAVPRRRLYDIINVLEAVEIVVRTGKLTYEWRGLSHLPDLLDRLARDEQNGVPVQDRVRRMVHKTVVVQKEGDETGEPQRREHVTRSLWMLSRKFVRLLLTHKEPIPLVEAAAMLIGNEPGSESAVHMTVERRLYDIGSILSSLGLIEKTYLGRNSSSGSKTRQPAFQWKYRYSKMSTRVQPSLQWGQAMESLGYPVAEPFPSMPVSAHMRGQRKSGTETDADLYMMQSQSLAKHGYMAGGYGCPGFALPYGTILMPPPMAAPPHGATYMLVPSPGMEDGKPYGMAMGTAQPGEVGKDQGVAGQNGTVQRADATDEWAGTAEAGMTNGVDGDASGGQRGSSRLQQQQHSQQAQQQQQRVQNSHMMMHMPHFMQAPAMMPAMSPHMYVPPMAMSPQQGSTVCPLPFGTPMLGPPMYAQGILPNGQPALFPTGMAPIPSLMHPHTTGAHALSMQPSNGPTTTQHDASQMEKSQQDPNTAATTPSSVGTDDPTETTAPSPAGVAGEGMAPPMVNGSMLYGLTGMNMPMMAMPGCVPVCMPHGGYAPNMGIPHAGMHPGYAGTNK